MLEAFGQALLNFGNIGVWIALLISIVLAIIVGILPGISGMIMMAIFLPFCFFLPPEIALTFMLALVATSMIGGAITSILLAIPGDPVNAPTILDGFSLTKKGQAGRAIGASVTSAGAAGVLTIIASLIIVPIILPVCMSVKSGDMVFIVLAGIAFIGVLGAGNMAKGIISGALGLLISMIGNQPVTGMARFTFDIGYLYDGIGFLPVILGLFAIPAAVGLASKGSIVKNVEIVRIEGLGEVWEGAKDVFRYWSVWLQSVIIGFIVGIAPGIGPSTASFVAYGRAKQASKYPEKFGKGAIEGVIAPEAANNASIAGDLLTTLALGIPGSSSMAILLGAFLITGLMPGPQMLTEHTSLSITLLLSVVFAKIIGAVICFFLAPSLARIATIPPRILFAPVVVLTIVGGFSFQAEFNDVIVCAFFGLLGILMQRWGYNRPALILGVIMGFLFEKYLFIALSASGPLFFMTPISLIIIILTIAMFAAGPIKRLFRSKGGTPQE